MSDEELDALAGTTLPPSVNTFPIQIAVAQACNEQSGSEVILVLLADGRIFRSSDCSNWQEVQGPWNS